MNEYALKFVEYIFPTSKDWTGFWFLRYRNLHLCFVNIHVIIDLCKIIPKSKFTQRMGKTCEIAASNEQVLGICKET